MNILLLDLDGVLVEPRGYHQALVESVRLIGQALGYPEAKPNARDIAEFEVAGITSEWDSAAACTALMLIHRWEEDADVGLPTRLSPPYATNPALKTPDFGAFARSLRRTATHASPPAQRLEEAIRERFEWLSHSQVEIIQELLSNATSAHGSVTHRTFQELVLGSQVYEEVYPYPAGLATNSYLDCHDHPNLSRAEQAMLRRWLAREHNSAAILTLRPSQPPGAQVFSTPEAESGAQIVGLVDVPIAGYGGLSWLGKLRDLNPRTLGKPSPVHALAALRLAAGDQLESALESSARLALDDLDDGEWGGFDRARVTVFEDSANGLGSVIGAKRVLAKLKIHLNVIMFGVATNRKKQKSLQAAGAEIAPSLPHALRSAGVIQ
ncbi:MAG TPA: hypothetical protein VFZ76_15895 [Anaerolineales bacterium]